MTFKYENEQLLISNLKAGFTAGLINSFIFHPPKTIIKYQYVNGSSLAFTLTKMVYNEDKLRLFRGISPNIIKYSVGKMGEASIYTYFKNIDKDNNEISKLSMTSLYITLWRINLMPFDTMSNTLQVHGQEGYQIIKRRIRSFGIGTLYSGTVIYGLINYINCFTWFGIYNTMNNLLDNDINGNILRNDKNGNIINANNDIKNGIIGFTSTLGSDIINNPFRVIKTYKQSYDTRISYTDSFNYIIKEGGYKNLFIRGFGVKTFLNCITSSFYVIMWKRLEDYF